MDEAAKILIEVLQNRGLSLDEIVEVTAGLVYPEVNLDMAEWILENPRATVNQMSNEGTKKLMNYMSNQKDIQHV